MRLLLRSVVISALILPTATALKCHSCLTHCRMTSAGTINAEKCDCISKEDAMCEGNACFAKIELFNDEKTAIMQKGCISDIPGGVEGCQMASNSETLHCFCSGDRCNVKEQMDDFEAKKLPTVECCACSEKHGERCSHDECPRKCTGSYCVVDFDGHEQGCGLGFPRLQSFLRMPKYTDWQGKPICARYEATQSTVMNGCTCTSPSGTCNQFTKSRDYQINNVIERSLDGQNYCYALAHKSTKPFGQEVFKRSSTCEGQYCFISYTSSEIVLESADFANDYADHDEFIGTSRPRFELLAGCLKIDHDEKLSLGCTTEYSTNTSEPLAKHCICQSHLCNFHHLITESADTRPRLTTAPVHPPSTRPTPPPITATNERSDRDANTVPPSSLSDEHPTSPSAPASSSIALALVVAVLR